MRVMSCTALANLLGTMTTEASPTSSCWHTPLVERGECGEAGLCMAGQWHLGEEGSQPGDSGTIWCGN